MRRRPRPAPPPRDPVSDAEAAELYRASVPPGWRLDGPEFASAQHAVIQILARRWRRRQLRERPPA
jgi:hypothetical protein